MSTKWRKRQNDKEKGFTLVELIIVMAILAILAGIGVPKYQSIRAASAVKADAATATSIVNAARIQETQTGTQLANYAALDTNIMAAATPQTGGTFVLSGGGTASYVVTWTPTKAAPYNVAQTVTEGTSFTIND